MRTNHRSESRPAGVRMLLFAGLGLFVAASAGAAARAVPIVDAAKAEDASTVRTLLEQQVDVNAAEVDGTTALHWAAYQGDAETARLLLAAGARTDVTNRYGVTPLALAAGRGDASRRRGVARTPAPTRTPRCPRERRFSWPPPAPVTSARCGCCWPTAPT